MKNIWAASIVVPLVAAILVAVLITAVGEFYLALGETGALIAAIALMTVITIIAAFFSLRVRGSR